MKLLFFLCLFLYSLTGFGQSGTLKGIVRNGISMDNSSFINIVLFSKTDRKFVLVAISDTLGEFKIKNIPIGFYDLEFSLIGFKTYTLSDVKIYSDSTTFLNIKFPCPYGKLKSKKECPLGHNDEIVNIVYGMSSKKMLKKAEKGKIHLGGCIITGCDPSRYCKKHKISF